MWRGELDRTHSSSGGEWREGGRLSGGGVCLWPVAAAAGVWCSSPLPVPSVRPRDRADLNAMSAFPCSAVRCSGRCDPIGRMAARCSALAWIPAARGQASASFPPHDSQRSIASASALDAPGWTNGSRETHTYLCSVTSRRRCLCPSARDALAGRPLHGLRLFNHLAGSRRRDDGG